MRPKQPNNSTRKHLAKIPSRQRLTETAKSRNVANEYL